VFGLERSAARQSSRRVSARVMCMLTVSDFYALHLLSDPFHRRGPPHFFLLRGRSGAAIMAFAPTDSKPPYYPSYGE
jgi:hypothetical protein